LGWKIGITVELEKSEIKRVRTKRRVDSVEFSQFLSTTLKRKITRQEIPFEGIKEFQPGEHIVLLFKEPMEVYSSDSDRMEKAGLIPSNDGYEDPIDREINELAIYGIDDCVNASDGYHTLPRMVCVSPTKSLNQVRDEAESKLGVSRDHYALVNQSHYLPQEGTWHHEIQWVETRCRGRAGGQKVVSLNPPRNRAIRWVDVATEETGIFKGPDAGELVNFLVNEEEIEDPILYREIGTDKIGIGMDQRMNGGKVSVYHREDLSAHDCFNRVIGVWIEQEGMMGETTADANEGTGSEIKAQLQELICFTVKRLWRGLYPLDDDETAVGETLDVEYEEKSGEVTIKLDSEKGTSITTFVRPLETLFDLLKAEFGWDNRVELHLVDGKKRIDYKHILKGSTLILKGLLGRERMVRATYPGEREQIQIPYENGREILEHIQEQVGTQVKSKIVEKGVIPCCEDFWEDEEYQDIGIEITLLGPMPDFMPVEHRDARFMTYRMRREQELWVIRSRQRHEYVGNFFRDRPSNPENQGFWNSIIGAYHQANREWIRNALPKLNPETIRPADVRQEARTAIFGAFSTTIKYQWLKDSVMQECLTLKEFEDKIHSAMGTAYFAWGSEAESAIKERASLWTENRETKMTSLIQSVDEAQSIAISDNRWRAGLMDPIFRYANPEVLAKHEKLIRALCAEESTIEGISLRCWLQFQRTEDEDEAKMIVDKHLERYGDVKDVVLDRLATGALSTLQRDDIDWEYKKAIGRHMLAILGAMGHGFTRHECKIFSAWWNDLKQGQVRTEEGWVKGEIKWCAIDMKEENLAKFVRDHLRNEPSSQVPLLIYRARMELTISKELVTQMMPEYLARGETAEEYVKLWWNLVAEKAVDFDWLIEDLQSGNWDAQDLRKAMFRSAGRNRPRVLNAATEQYQTGELGEMLAVLLKVGFAFTTEVKEILEKRLLNDADPKECVKAMKAISEHRAETLSTFQDWQSSLRS
jgi:hypothetical protein